MAEEGQADAAAHQHLERLLDRDHVLVFIEWRSVREQRDIFLRGTAPGSRRASRGFMPGQALCFELQFQWPSWKYAQPLEIFRSKNVFGPGGSGGGYRVELVEVRQSGAGLVVVAADKHGTDAAREISDFVGAGAITNHIAQIGYAIVGWRGIKTGGQSLQIS